MIQDNFEGYCNDPDTEMVDRIELGLKLLDWHGGQGSGLYAVGSTLFAGKEPDPTSIRRAIDELVNLKRDAVFPQCVSPKDEEDCNKLAAKLRELYPQDQGAGL